VQLIGIPTIEDRTPWDMTFDDGRFGDDVLGTKNVGTEFCGIFGKGFYQKLN
jgi:hypothetical protein